MARRAWLLAGLMTLAACTGAARPTTAPEAVDSAPRVTPAAPSPVAEPTSSAAPTPTASPTFKPLPSDLPEEIAKAIEWRRSFGLRSDVEWVIAVHADPTADDAWDYPILPEEEEFIVARQRELMGFAGHVRWYASQNPKIYGGTYFDNANNRVMSLWTEDPERHLSAILGRAGADAPIAATLVRWTEGELEAAQDLVGLDDDWFGEFEAEWQGSGVDIVDNEVDIEISSANPDAPRLIAERLAQRHGVPLEMLHVVSDGTGLSLLAKGRVVGVVVTADGGPPGRNDLWMDGEPQGVGVCPNEPFPSTVDRDGRFELWCTVGTWRIQAVLWDDSHESSTVVGESSRLVEVRADEAARVRVRLDEGAPVR